MKLKLFGNLQGNHVAVLQYNIKKSINDNEKDLPTLFNHNRLSYYSKIYAQESYFTEKVLMQ